MHPHQHQQQQQQHSQMAHAPPVQPQLTYVMQATEASLQGEGAVVYHQLHPMQRLQQQQPQTQLYVHPQQGHQSFMVQHPSMMGMQQQHQHHALYQQQPQQYQQQPSPQEPPPLQQQAQSESLWEPGVENVDLSLSGDLEEFSELFSRESGLIGDGAFMPMTSTLPGQGPIGERKRAKKMVTKTATAEEIKLRRERNLLHARRSRLRRNLLLESLRDQLIGLRRDNASLRQIVKQRCGQKAPEIFEKCCTDMSPMLADMLCSTGEGEDGKVPRAMDDKDKKLMLALQEAQQSFAVYSATSLGNTIIFASERFLKLTGYTLEQVVGRPALFLQGVGTSHKDLEMVNRGIAEGRDTTVCLLNYKADGTAFWNQMFVGPLFDAEEKPIYFVGVHCDIEERSLDNELKNVVKKTSVDVMETSGSGK